MKETKNVPQLRFSGFDDEWEEKKLGECFKERTQRSAIGELISVTISSGVKKASELERHDSSSEDKSNYKCVYKGDIAYNSMRMWQGASGVSNFDGILSPAYTVCIPDDNTDSVFFSYMFKIPKIVHTFEINSQGLTKDTWNLKFPAFSLISINATTLAEQQKIGTFLSHVDSLIQAKTKKLESLKAVKKSLLQKCFPKAGEKVPEMRFAEFSGDWEEKKLGEIATKVIDKNFDLSVQEVFTNSAEFGVISQRDFFDHDIANTANIDGYYVIQNEDFVYNPRISVTAPVGPINRNNLGRKGIMSPLYTIFRTKNINTLYLEWYFKTDCWHDFMYLNGDSGARFDRFSIKDIVFFEMPILFPASVAEQQKIGEFFLKYDSLISAQQKEIDKLKDIKKSLLQKMFI